MSNFLKKAFNSVSFESVHYVVAMLKEYGIKHIVASPGTQNSFFCYLVQSDDFFKYYSVVDERSAGYVASGIAYETNEPVVITCTGATASRNYLSSLTEAYYRKLPIIAITCVTSKASKYSMTAQYIDRSISPNDVKNVSVSLPRIDNKKDVKKCLTLLNVAFMTAKYRKEPVHINLSTTFEYENKNLPTDVWKCEYYMDISDDLKDELRNKKIAVYIGSHSKFSKEDSYALENFAKSWNIPIFCDHISNYHGANKVLSSQIAKKLNILEKPEIIIDIGYTTGDYTHESLFEKAKIWRISEDGEFRSRLSKPVLKLFNCSENRFFTTMANTSSERQNYYDTLKEKIESNTNIDLPLCNGLVCQSLSKYMQKNASLHLSILNSLRNMNYFSLDDSIDVNCNVGGFGIDGPLSTIFGQALVCNDKICYGVIGDLAFFYDMNILGNRSLPNNLKLILINNNAGIEFRLNKNIEGHIGSDADLLIAAGGHYGNGAQKWVESCNFYYMQARDKESFLSQIQEFCTKDYHKPVIFEVFTNCEDEKKGAKLLKDNSR